MSIKKNFLAIQGWMLEELHLKGNELIVYAVVYGFSQAKGQTFRGNIKYLCEWTNATEKTVINALKSLCEKGLLKKKEHKGGVNEYIAIIPEDESNDNPEPKKRKSKSDKQKKTYGEHGNVKLTDKEHEDLMKKNSPAVVEGFIRELDELIKYLRASGKKVNIKNHFDYLQRKIKEDERYDE